MKKGSGREPGGGRSIAGAALILLLILLGVGAFTFHLYTRIVNESKTLAWEMTLKSAEVMELRLEDIRSSLAAFSRSVASSGAGPGEVGEMASRQLDGHPIFRLHVVTEEGAPLTEDYGLTAGDAARLEELCPEDGAFSAGYLGKSGRWQTAVAVSGTVAGVPCRFYAECVLDDLYMDDFMEFHSQQGYCYMISGGEGTFIMLPHNKFGQGLRSGLTGTTTNFKDRQVLHWQHLPVPLRTFRDVHIPNHANIRVMDFPPFGWRVWTTSHPSHAPRFSQ